MGNGRIEIHEASADAFRLVLQGLYSDDLSFVERQVDVELLSGLVALAHRFGMSLFKNRATGCLANILEDNLLAGDVASWLTFSRAYSARKVADICLKFISENPQDVLIAQAGKDWSKDMETYKEIVCAATQKRRRLGEP